MDARAHAGLEEAVGPAPVGLGFVHRQIGVLEQLIEIGAMLRRKRDADAGVGGQEMAEAFVRLADRMVDPRDQFHGRRSVPATSVWMIANSSPPSRATTSSAPTQARRRPATRLEQFIANGVPERIVDPLEFVDVDVEHRQLLAGRHDPQAVVEALAEQHAVRQIGQRIVMRHVGDAPCRSACAR